MPALESLEVASDIGDAALGAVGDHPGLRQVKLSGNAPPEQALAALGRFGGSLEREIRVAEGRLDN